MKCRIMRGCEERQSWNEGLLARKMSLPGGGGPGSVRVVKFAVSREEGAVARSHIHY
jgi:hypothetical protein